MGGLTFNTGRLERALYLRLEAQVREVLGDVFGPDWRIPLYHTDKADFGDLDLLVAAPRLTPAALRTFGEAVQARDHRRQNMGHSYLVPVPGEDRAFQVDLLPTPSAELDSRFAFMSWGDLGNILGRMVKPLGLKWGEGGLSSVHRVPGDEHWKREQPLSADLQVLLAALGLDPAVHRAGYPDEEAMFRYLASSPMFRPFPFLNPRGSVARRVKGRPGMERFVAFLNREGFLPGEKAPRFAPQETEALLPGSGILALVEACEAEYARLQKVRAHFDGRRVMRLTGRSGAPLGHLMVRLRAGEIEALALTGDDRAIDAAILAADAALRAEEGEEGPAPDQVSAAP